MVNLTFLRSEIDFFRQGCVILLFKVAKITFCKGFLNENLLNGAKTNQI